MLYLNISIVLVKNFYAEKERNRTLELHEAEREAKSIFSQNSKGINKEGSVLIIIYSQEYQGSAYTKNTKTLFIRDF